MVSEIINFKEKRNNKDKFKSKIKVAVAKSKKEIFKLYDIYIESLMLEGMHFFFFTINLKTLIKIYTKQLKNH